MNRITISGNTGHSAVSRATQNGGMVTFSLAVSDRRKNEKGDYETIRTDWFDCVMYTSTAEGASRFGAALPAGTKVLVSGEMQSSQYEKDGQKRTSWRILVREIEILYIPQAQASQQAGNITSQPANADVSQQAAQPVKEQPQQNDDLPF